VGIENEDSTPDRLKLNEMGHLNDDPVEVYLATLREEAPPLSGQEEILCVQHIRAKDQHSESARLRLFQHYAQLVVTIAKRFQNDRIHVLDLIVKGNEGLMEALNGFADSQDESFAAYARRYIERAVSQTAARC
jgi:DNA-directed RNA polymerase specialized sigma subunit